MPRPAETPSPFARLAALSATTLPRRLRIFGPADLPWDAVNAAPTAGKRSSAVVMLFIPGPTPEAPAEIVFTRRSTTVRSHKGQIGFPGGRAEDGDASPAATALRELEEELGIPAAGIETVAALTPLPALDGSAVHPVVAVGKITLAACRPAPDEVDEVFSAPWPLVAAAAAQRFAFNIFGNWRDSALFPLPGRPIWGLTAKILRQAELA